MFIVTEYAALIFISGHGSAIASVIQGKPGSNNYNLVKNFKISCLGRANRIHTELASIIFLSSTKIFEAS